jgi:pimeloyl-ACP methyl ester carboxylesterase
VIGYSMGGAIATAFAAARPGMARAVVLLAPAGMQSLGLGALGRLIGLPLLGRWAMLARYPAVLRRGLAAEAESSHAVPEVNRLQRAELEYRGFVPAVHESLRGTLRDDIEPLHRGLARAGTPVLAVWGGQDAVIPLSARDILQGWNPEVRHHVIDEAGHGLPYTHDAQVLAAILPFLKEAA